MTNLGRKLILHKIDFPDLRNDPDKFVVIEIIKVREVPDIWRPNTFHEGWLAEDINNKRNLFTCNWDSFPSDSTTPTWMWYKIEPEPVGIKDLDWYDVTQGLYLPPGLGKPVWIDELDGAEEIVGYCEIHNCLFYKDKYEQECWRCHHRIPPQDFSDDLRWVGWYKEIYKKR